MDIQEFYKDKEKRDLIDTITTAKWVTEEQKEAMIGILAEDADDDMKAAREKKDRERKRAQKKDSGKIAGKGRVVFGNRAPLSMPGSHN